MKYQCLNDGTIFSVLTSDKFIKTVLPKCPICGRSQVTTSINKSLKKAEFAIKKNT